MKSIHINADGDNAWVGGLYYKRNILFSLLQNKDICNKYNFVVTVKRENLDFYKCFSDAVIFDIIDEYGFNYKIKQIKNCLKYRIRFSYPSKKNKVREFLNVHCIRWIPDFQHNVFPEFFTEEELNKRTKEYVEIKESGNPLVLSSLSAKNDFINYYGEKSEIYVVPFVSFIEPEIRQISQSNEQDIMHKYQIESGNYACISNQFWKHKNHIVVFKAIKQLTSTITNGFKFVFTGYPEDQRDLEYYKNLMRYIDDPDVKKHCSIIGFIDRVDQLAIMKNSKFVIQPSLFEGWGTVVEDAKVLDKLILLSNIPVHTEQMNRNCTLFEPHNPEDLAEKIDNMLKTNHIGDVENGIKDMYTRAEQYSQGFMKLLNEFEN